MNIVITDHNEIVRQKSIEVRAQALESTLNPIYLTLKYSNISGRKTLRTSVAVLQLVIEIRLHL